MKVLWASNAPWIGTGYGQQTADIVKRIQGDGHDVAVASNFGLHGSTITWNGVQVFPTGYDAYSNDVTPDHAAYFLGDRDAGWLITLMDVWVFQGVRWKDWRIASWTPVDHDPAPASVIKWFMDTGTVPIAMSRFGGERLVKAGLQPLYAPHGIDTEVFKPGDKAKGKALLKADDRFVVGVVAANKGQWPPRKSWPEMFMAFAQFLADAPDALLYAHTDAYGHADGLNLFHLAEAVGIPERNITFTDPYNYRMGLPPKQLAEVYSGFDVLMAPSMGEGFGIPVVEAQACGVPVIVSNFSAQPELVGAGWLVDGQPFWDPRQGSFFFQPFVWSIYTKLREAYDARGDRHVEAQARRFARTYDATYVYDTYWRPILDKLGAELTSTVPAAEGVDVGAW